MRANHKSAATRTKNTTQLNITDSPIRLIVGLGNPGSKYQNTRHNAGFIVLNSLAQKHNLQFSKGFKAQETLLKDIYMIKPQTYMNLSGQSVKKYAKVFNLKANNILVVHDDLDLPLGRIRLKTGGSAAGQKGVKDTEQYMGSGFHRLKIGIGRPDDGTAIPDWVLGKFNGSEKQLIDEVVPVAVKAIETLLQEDISKAMTLYNGTDLRS